MKKKAKINMQKFYMYVAYAFYVVSIQCSFVVGTEVSRRDIPGILVFIGLTIMTGVTSLACLEYSESLKDEFQ